MNREAVIDNRLRGNKLPIDSLNKAMAVLGAQLGEVLTNQVYYIDNTSVLKFVAKHIKKISLVTYAFNYHNINGLDIHKFDDFQVLSGGTDISSNKVQSYREEPLEEGIVQVQVITKTVTEYSDLTSLELNNFTFQSGETDTRKENYADIGNQYTFFIMHPENNTQSNFVRAVGDIYQGNYDILNNHKLWLDKQIVKPIMRNEIYKKTLLSQDFVGVKGEYNLLVLADAYVNNDDIDIEESLITKNLERYVSGSAGKLYNIYANSKQTDEQFYINDDINKNGLKAFLPSTFNNKIIGDTLAYTNYYNYFYTLPSFTQTQSDAGFLSSFMVNLVIQTSNLKFYNLNLTKYCAVDYNTDGYTSVKKREKRGFLNFVKSTGSSSLGKIYIANTSLSLKFSKSEGN